MVTDFDIAPLTNPPDQIISMKAHKIMKHWTLLVISIGIVVFVAGCSTTSQLKTPSWESRFQEADTNKDGHVSRNEFGYLMAEDAFTLYDSNKNGIVTLEEYVAKGGTPKTFAKIDPSGSGKVTLEQIKASKVAMDHLTIQFYEADVDKNGYVTLEEALEYRDRVREITRG